MAMTSWKRVSAGMTCLVLLGILLPAGRAAAVRVADVYAETVPLGADTAEARQAAFAEALRRVLVKATGHSAAAAEAARFGEASRLVQQFRLEQGGLWARFDPAAVRRGLDAAAIPVWGDDRPLTAVWLAFDAGGGDRDVVAASAAEGAAAALRRELLQAASVRAVPVVLPLRDSEEIAAVSYADVWGDFTGEIVGASRRYQADAVLVGRARLTPPGMTDVRWTLLLGEERVEWRGSIADGPVGLAERLSQRLAAARGAAQAPGTWRLEIGGIRTLDDYGMVLAYLSGLDGVQAVRVAGAAGDVMAFELSARLGRAQLQEALVARRLLEPVGEELAAIDAALRYRLAGVP